MILFNYICFHTFQLVGLELTAHDPFYNGKPPMEMTFFSHGILVPSQNDFFFNGVVFFWTFVVAADAPNVNDSDDDDDEPSNTHYNSRTALTTAESYGSDADSNPSEPVIMVQVNEFPPMSVTRRQDNWGWRMENHWVQFDSTNVKANLPCP